MPPSKKGKRKVQCAAKVKLGATKGFQCKRTKMLEVDEHNNVRVWRCTLHDK